MISKKDLLTMQKTLKTSIGKSEAHIKTSAFAKKQSHEKAQIHTYLNQTRSLLTQTDARLEQHG